MRIIAGSKRAMRLLSPKTCDTRPITDRVKESLFNVLSNYGLPAGRVAADLFCGVGSLGLEALSRAADFVTFVDLDPQTISVLEKNIEKAGFVANSKVIRADVFKTGAPLDWAIHRYDLVFVDPPYACTQDVGPDSSLTRLFFLLQNQVTSDAIVVVRTHRRVLLPDEYSRFRILERREYGTMALTILGTE